MIRGERVARTCLAVAIALLFWGCSSSSDSAPKFNATTGQHPAGWKQNHWAEYLKNPGQCETCHGSTTDTANAGGVAKVSCFTCHPGGVNHPAGWASPGQHGRRGAQLAPNAADPFAMAGFARCAKCHGSDFAGGLSGVSCKSCHKKAPHPDLPWRGNTALLSNHDKTDVHNAVTCAKCHTAPLAPAGVEPGCYNNTMCHGTSFTP